MRHRSVANWLGVAASTLLMLAVGDYLYGKLTDIAEIRVAARQFRAEAAPYALHASSLVPGTDHLYGRSIPEGDGFRRFRVNSLGAVSSPNDLPVAEWTILFLGGSTTESNEVEETNRFPFVVQELLRKAGVELRVVNGGVRGHTTQDSLISYLARPKYRTAQFVVLMHNINDRLWLTRFDDYTVPPSTAGLTSGAAVTQTASELVRTAWDFVSYRSNIIFVARQRLTYFNPWTGEAAVDGVISDRIIDHKSDQAIARVMAYEQNLRAFVAIVRSQGAMPVLMTQPLGRDSKGQTVFNKSVRRIASEESVHIIDLDSELPTDRRWAFLDDNIHLSDAGSRALGGMIAESLASLLGTAVEAPKNDSTIVPIPNALARCASPPGDIDDFQASRPHRILSTTGRYPSFSSDGNWMTYQSWKDGIDRLQAYNVTTDTIVDLSPSDAPAVNERHPSVLRAAPNALTVVFGSGFDPEADGFERLKLRHWPSMQTEDLITDLRIGGAIPAVSQDRIIFAGFGRTGRSRMPDLMALKTGETTPVRLMQTPYEEWRPALAADGTVYFIANPDGNFDIFALAAGEPEASRVYSSDADEWDPAISPDSRWLTFASKVSGNWGLMLLDRMTGKARSITSGPQDDWDPSFHPDGRLIVFGRSTGGEPAIYSICAFGEVAP